MSDLVGNPEDRFSHVEAHISLDKAIFAKGRGEGAERSIYSCLFSFSMNYV